MKNNAELQKDLQNAIKWKPLLNAVEVDIGLTTLGAQEARFAGILLKSYIIDMAFTSVLKRAVYTLAIILGEMGKNIPVIKSAALNERNCGDLRA